MAADRPHTAVLDPHDLAGLLDRAARVIEEGGVVLAPTETVYGLFARADSDAARERLRAIKGRDERPFARMVAGLATVEAEGAVLPAPALRLARRFWPGPLTLVLDVPVDGGPETRTVGYRVPGHTFARALVERAGVPVVATSANRSGQPETSTFAAAMEAVGAEVDLAIDGGAAQLAAASTVVRVPTRGPVEVLREGFLGPAAVERTITRLFLFVCTGNTCRSPMAEALFRHGLARRLGVAPGELTDLGWRVASAGISAGPGAPAAANARSVLSGRGVDLGEHRSQPLTEDLVERAERIYALTDSHRQAILEWFPEQADKVRLLDPRGIPDPIGYGLSVYQACAEQIAAAVEEVIDEVAGEAEQEAAGAAPPREASRRPAGEPVDLERLHPAAGEVPAAHDAEPCAEADTYLVAGEVRRWAGPCQPVLSPLRERQPDGTLVPRELGRSALLPAEVATEALEAAVRAWDRGQGAWPRASLGERTKALRGLAEALRAQRDTLARLLMWEVGKPWKQAVAEVDRTVEYVDATLHQLRQLERSGGRFRAEGGALGVVRRAPLGVVLCLGPFNYPLNETLTTVIPALAMGNTCLVKLPRMGLLSNLPLLPALAEHFPPGAVNVLHGDGPTLIGPLLRSGQVDALAFIGSTRVARLLLDQHPEPTRLRSILGLEAKNAGIFLPDADLARAVPEAVRGALSFSGQRCTALKVLFVPRARADEVVARLVDEVEALPFGMPWEPGVVLTPLAEADKPAALAALVQDAVDRGARVVNPSGGRTSGSFYFPAVVYPTPREARLFHEEQFGPVVPVVPYDDIQEVLDAVGRSPWGQQVSLFGEDPRVLGPLVDVLVNMVCRVNLNRQCQRGPDTFPFGGRRGAARGTLSILDGLEAFSIPVVAATGDDPRGRALLEGMLEADAARFFRFEV